MMKKNLLIFTTLLGVVGLLTRYTPDRLAETALEQDLQAGLSELWHDPKQRVTVHDGVAEIGVSRADDAHTSLELVKFICAVHPKVRLNGLEIESGGRLLRDVPPSVESVLATRQAQAQLDEVMGPGRSLVLVEVEPGAPTKSEMNMPGGFESNGRCYLLSRPPAAKKIRHVRLFVLKMSERRMEGVVVCGLNLSPEDGDTIETFAWARPANS